MRFRGGEQHSPAGDIAGLTDFAARSERSAPAKAHRELQGNPAELAALHRSNRTARGQG